MVTRPRTGPRSPRRRRVRPSESDAPALLRAKLSQPNLGDVLQRDRLIEALQRQASVPLTLVLADAGYGKTVLVASFARTIQRPVIWYSLMGSDADPIVFGRHLLEGFRRDHPRFGKDFERALAEAHGGGRSAEMLGGVLAHALAELKGPPRLLVLDDFHEVAHQPAPAAMVGMLLRYLPPSVRMIITSRTEPGLPLQRMRSRGEVFELHSEHLRYTRDELERLFEEVYQQPLGAEELDTIERATMGWPTAVHLVRESLQGPAGAGLDRVLVHLQASSLHVHEYLSAEVFAGLPRDNQRLLEHVGPLARIEPEIAESVSGLKDARARLEALAHQGLLRSFGDGARASYACHGLIRRFIRRAIESKSGEDGWRALELRAARALHERGFEERALRHYLAAHAHEESRDLLVKLSGTLLREGRATTLLEHFEALPDDFIRADPSLLVSFADALQALGRWDEAHTHYAMALEHWGAAPPHVEECRAVLGLAKVLQMRGKHEDVLDMVDRCIARAEDVPLELKARLLQRKAGACYYMGNYDASLQILETIRRMLPPSADSELLVPVVHNQAIAYAAQGRHREAAREFRAALSRVRGSASPRAPLYMSNLALLLTYQGDLVEARRVVEEGLDAARRFSNRAQETACLEVQAQIMAESGDLDGALAAIRNAEEINDELRMELLSADLLGLKGRIFCARGQYRRAVSFLSQAVERLSERPGSPRLIEFRATLAWCELRAGRIRVAREMLDDLVEAADRGANDFERTQVHYWLAEAQLGLGMTGLADAHLSLALRLARERGYDHLLRVQAREEPAPLLHALGRGIETDICSGVLAECGSAVEPALVAMLPDASDETAEAIVSVLGEVGGPNARECLTALAKSRPVLKPTVRSAARHIDERQSRLLSASGTATPPRLYVFGPPRLEIDGKPLPASAWRAQRAFQMLVFLVLHPRGATRDELLEQFWPGRQLAAGRRNFHPTLSYIRSVLPRASVPALLREADSYRLNPEYPMTCDLWDFNAARDAARAAQNEDEKRAAMEQATTLAEAPLLEGTYGDWARDASAQVRDRVEALRLELGQLHLKAGDPQQALGHLRAAAELDLYRESTRVGVIECLVRLGNRRAAVVEFDRLRGLLRAELSVDPLPETEEAGRKLFSEALGGAPAQTSKATVSQRDR
jgi:LuxR family maltose regulon positive regulatory protein